jgi:hypothetical protein
MANILKIFWQSLELYFGSLPSFLKYMAFPVLGQIIGCIWVFGFSYLYIEYLPKLLSNKIMDNFSVIFFILLLITLPGLFIMLKAFWEYLVAYGAINSMLDGLVKTGKVYDFPAHNEVIVRKTLKYVGLWLIISIISLISLIPIFWIFGAILFVYFILVFQVFVFEPDENIINCFKRSFQIIKGKFAQTFFLMILIGGFSCWLLPAIASKILEVSKIINYLVIPFDNLVRLLPISAINEIITFRLNSLMIAYIVATCLINQIIIQFTLPLRSICWGLWYRKNVKAKSKIDKRILKRAEE